MHFNIRQLQLWESTAFKAQRENQFSPANNPRLNKITQMTAIFIFAFFSDGWIATRLLTITRRRRDFNLVVVWASSTVVVRSVVVRCVSWSLSIGRPSLTRSECNFGSQLIEGVLRQVVVLLEDVRLDLVICQLLKIKSCSCCQTDAYVLD